MSNKQIYKLLKMTDRFGNPKQSNEFRDYLENSYILLGDISVNERLVFLAGHDLDTIKYTSQPITATNILEISYLDNRMLVITTNNTIYTFEYLRDYEEKPAYKLFNVPLKTKEMLIILSDSGSTAIGIVEYKKGNKLCTIEPNIHLGMFVDTLLFMDKNIDIRFYVRNMGLEFYSWSGDIEKIHFLNLKDIELDVKYCENKVLLTKGKLETIVKDEEKCVF